MLFIAALSLVFSSSVSDDSSLPRFAEPVLNVTVIQGKDALMACVVENLQKYKVAWVKVKTQTILSIHHDVITQNERIHISYNDHRSWYLHIRNVNEADRGWYMCQINTTPMLNQKGFLQVVVSPRIIAEESSAGDIITREKTDVILKCRAGGYPEPYIMWRREDGKDINYNGVMVNVVDGEDLHLMKVSRLHMGVYLCIAANGVPPPVNRRVSLTVHFPPMLTIPYQLEAAYLGKTVTLECLTEAFPPSLNYWTTERGDMILSGDGFEDNRTQTEYACHMKLTILHVTAAHYGNYRCVAVNALGETDGVIKLYEIDSPKEAVAVFTMDEHHDSHKNDKYRSTTNNRISDSFNYEDYYLWQSQGGKNQSKSKEDSKKSNGAACTVPHFCYLPLLYSILRFVFSYVFTIK
ncbi:unnamed protein product [Bemisia tabaci]|uniref:Ig-like domain-containing protein n=2 Tax=Bemisia tabaci TaxID=7038 RepID=A0A9P0F2A5_BEMTA|nr:unnamed protein product [Bemisia tabaci]